MAMAVRDVVLDALKAQGQLPKYYVLRRMLEIPKQVWRCAHPLVGRDSELQHIMDSLDRHRAAVVWGGPGEGKSSLAMEAACQLWDQGRCLGGCFYVDCLGELCALSAVSVKLSHLKTLFTHTCVATKI